MPRNYNNRYVTKSYVDTKINESQWSPIQRCSLDLQNESVAGSNGEIFNLYTPIVNTIGQRDMWTQYTKGTDNITAYESHIRIKYIRIHIRCATGESEETSAVSQTVRVLLFRGITNLSEGNTSVVVDVDSMPIYGNLYGDINGLWYDKTQYVHSWATDGDTTAGGQVMFKKLVKPKHSEVILSEDLENYDSHKGCVFLQVCGDDPTGTNSSYYGFVEIGFVVKED